VNYREDRIAQDYRPSRMTNTLFSVLVLSLAAGALAQRTCEGAGEPADAVVPAKGLRAYVVANGLTKPRGIAFDKDDNLLVVEEGKGVTALKIQDDNGCLSLASKDSIIENSEVGCAG
jgi:glucose/arabinose dehydrogenase